jgi:hypothetical protein
MKLLRTGLAAIVAALLLAALSAPASATDPGEEGGGSGGGTTDPVLPCKPIGQVYVSGGQIVFHSWTDCIEPSLYEISAGYQVDDDYIYPSDPGGPTVAERYLMCKGPLDQGPGPDVQRACGLHGIYYRIPIRPGYHHYMVGITMVVAKDGQNPDFWMGSGDLYYSSIDTPSDPYDPASPVNDTGGGSSSGPAPRADAAMVYDQGNASAKIYRWYSSGSAFGRLSDYQSGAFHLSNVGDRVAAGDVDGDGKDDVVMAYQLGDGTFAFYVFKRGITGSGQWYVSGAFNLTSVRGRLVVGDFTGDGKAEPALVRDNGDGTMTIYRWQSTGSSFTRLADYHSGAFSMSNVGERVAAGDVDGDGKDDVVMAYQLGDGTFAFYVFRSGISSLGQWYVSGNYGLGPVAGRMVVADFTGDGKAEPALVRDNGDGTMRIYRWKSSGSSFTRLTDYSSGSFSLANVGDRVASGDVTGDGKADIVMAYQNGNGTSTLHVFDAGASWAGRWYTGGQYNLDNVAGRLIVGNWY